MVGLIKKVFGGGKSDFFMELDGDDASESTSETQTSAPPVEEDKESAESDTESKVEEKSTEAVTEPSEEKKEKTKSKKKAKKQASEAKTESPKSQPVSAASVSSTNNAKKEEPQGSFDPNFLVPTPTQSRRRPGPSLKKFQEMARQIGR